MLYVTKGNYIYIIYFAKKFNLNDCKMLIRLKLSKINVGLITVNGCRIGMAQTERKLYKMIQLNSQKIKKDLP